VTSSNPLASIRCALLLLLAVAYSCAATAEQPQVPQLGSVWLEQVSGNPERAGAASGRGLQRVDADSGLYRFSEGQYRSTLSRIRLKLPRIGSEDKVTVREAIVLRRPDGAAATTHLVFIPGAVAVAPAGDVAAISAVVVTRLRDDRPKDRESVLAEWEPRGAVADGMRTAGITWQRIELPNFGEGVQRIIRNRASIEPFPYRTVLLKSGKIESVGVTRFAVAGEDSLLEFSQVTPCAGTGEEECVKSALGNADRFIEGVSEFLTLSPRK
jgi:hypothetical protein